MQFSFAAVLALATAVFAQERAPLPNSAFDPVTSPTEHQKVQAGSTLNIKWTVAPQFASTKVNLILIGGPEQNLQTPLLRIVDGLDNSLGEYAWSVPADQGGFDWYGITIEDVADTFNNYQFSPPFDILKGDSSSSGTSTVTITTASGTATVILSSAVPTTTSESSSAVETTSSVKETSSAIKTTSVVVPSSSVAYPVPTLVSVTSSSVAIVAASSTSAVPAAESSAVLVSDSGAAQAKTGIFAVLGGLAVAAFML